MAHELDTSNGRVNFAFTGDRSKIWHGLGQEIGDTESIETWVQAAGLDWEIKDAAVAYTAQEATSNLPSKRYVPDRKVLYRSDTLEPLSIVGKDFKVVQPKEVVEFFRTLIEQNGMKLSTAGSLFGGKRFWALADVGKEVEVADGDVIKAHLLLVTAVDGTLKTTGKFVSERPVCNNTLSIALSESSKNVVAISHRSEWDPEKVKVDLGIMDASWFEFITNIRKMAKTKVSDRVAEDFYQELVFDTKREQPTRSELRKVETLLDKYRNGAGSDMSAGTLWGLVNGATDLFTHGTGKRSPSNQFYDALISGYQDNMKTLAYEKALELVI